MKTKHIISLFVSISFLLIQFACQKNADSQLPKPPVVIQKENVTPSALANDADFIRLNNLANRFDPKFLQIVFKDKRTVEEILSASNDLMLQLQSDPENESFQKAIADFYKFPSLEDFKKASQSISESQKALDAKYNLGGLQGGNDLGPVLSQARKLYIKNKQKNNKLVTATNRSFTTHWSEDMAEAYSEESEFDYFSYLFDDYYGIGDDGGDLTQYCKAQLDVCNAEAKGNLITNLLKYGAGGAVTFGTVAVKATAVTSIATMGASSAIAILVSGAVGGTLGVMVAFKMYDNDLTICKAKYNLCLQTK